MSRKLTMSSDADEGRLHDWIAGLSSEVDWEGRSNFERTLLLAYNFELEVSNGGLDQYFLNPAGDKWQETLAALRQIGATRIVRIFEKALEVFPNRTPSTNQIIRCGQLDDANPRAGDILNQLTDEYYAIYAEHPEEDIYKKMIGFFKTGVC
jgi:hypothetical protein